MRLCGMLSANGVLAKLPGEELEQLRPHLLRVRLVNLQVLVERGQANEHVFFIEEGIVALLAEAEIGAGVQVAMIGREGVVGSLVLLDGNAVAHTSAVTQVPGTALRIPVAALRRSCERSAVLRDLCFADIGSLTQQIMHVSAWNASSSLAKRYARWLLLAHERVPGDTVPVTHGALAAMLGVRRSGVTVAAATLQRAGLIRTTRGQVRVLDRAGLHAFIRTDADTRPAETGAAKTGGPTPLTEQTRADHAQASHTYEEVGRS